MDALTNYVERLEKKKANSALLMKRIAIVGVTAIFISLSFFFFMTVEILKPFVYVLPLLWAFAVYFAYLLFGKTLIEYEYAVVSGYFQLDVIYGKKMRKKVCELKVADFSVVAPVSEKNERERKAFDGQVADASGSVADPDRFYIMGTDGENRKWLVYVNAGKKELDCFCSFNRRAVDRGEF